VKSSEKVEIGCKTSKGPFTLHLYRKWSPNGYDRAVELFSRGYYDNSHFFRVIPSFLVQFGLSYSNNKELLRFADTTIPDDPQLNPRIKFREGILSYAGNGKNSRTSQLFISYGSAASLGTQPWETPVGEVVEGMDIIRDLYSKYGDSRGPEQHLIRNKGLSYIEENFPELDKFKTCVVKSLSHREKLLPQIINTDDQEVKNLRFHSRSARADLETIETQQNLSKLQYFMALNFVAFITYIWYKVRCRKDNSKTN